MTLLEAGGPGLLFPDRKPIPAATGELRLALMAARMAMWQYDFKTERLETSPELNAVLGFPLDAKPHLDEIRARFPPGELERMRMAVQRALAQTPSQFEHEFRYFWAAGEERVLLVRAKLLRGPAGELASMSGMVMDVTERARAEREKDLALQRVQMMVREMSHRIKNNLQMVSSLLSMQQATMADEQAAESLVRARERIATIALLHNSLYRNAEFERLDAHEYLTGLCSHIGEVMVGRRPIRLTADIAPVSICVDRAVPLGLLVNELVTNSIKHAFGDAGGEVSVRLAREGGELVLEVADNGHGFTCDGEGLGMRLIRVFADQLGGDFSLESNPQGTRARLRIPA